MMIFSKSARILLAALALGGAALAATGEASARPGGRGGHGWHGGGHGGHGWHGGHRWGGHHGHRRHWGGYGYGLAGVAYVAGGSRCRLVERVNAYGDVVVRRVCRNPIYY